LTEPPPGSELPFFIVHFLGDKNPLFDIFVELFGAGDKTPYFFAQVKSTRQVYAKTNRLKVSVSKEDVSKMVLYPAPTFVIGIDEKKEKAYIVAVTSGMSNKTIRTLNTTHELNCETLRFLWEEVKEYWVEKDMAQKTTRFKNSR